MPRGVEGTCLWCDAKATKEVDGRPYCAEHAVAVKANSRTYKQSLKRRAGQEAARYARNPNYYLKHTEWRERNNERQTTHRTNSRAKRMGAKGTFKPEEFVALCERKGMQCAYCSMPLTFEPNKENTATPDHVIPLSHGGKNFIWNIVPCCWECNHEKGDRTPREWFAARVREGLSARPRWNAT